MTNLPDPVLTEHDGIIVVRDDLLPGGTKRRALHVLLDEHEEYVYASPVYGYAQLALAHCAADYGKRATIFCAARNKWHPLTQATAKAGAKIVEVQHGYLSVVTARARSYAEGIGAKLLPFGLDDPKFMAALTLVALRLPVKPQEVWTVVGSGTLSRALQRAWPDAQFYGVRIGSVPSAGRAVVFAAPEPYDRAARLLPPFPSCVNYDAKAWRFLRDRAKPGALFWNVGA